MVDLGKDHTIHNRQYYISNSINIFLVMIIKVKYLSLKQNWYLCQYLDCQAALGIANRLISDGQMSASSQLDYNHAASQGRLHFQAVPGSGGSWTAQRSDIHQWLQIDLGNQQTKVTCVATQGRNGQNQWVTKYKLEYGEDGENFQYYREQGQNVDKVRKAFSTKKQNNSVVYLNYTSFYRLKANTFRK